jgi:hypothetical protein
MKWFMREREQAAMLATERKISRIQCGDAKHAGRSTLPARTM